MIHTEGLSLLKFKPRNSSWDQYYVGDGKLSLSSLKQTYVLCKILNISQTGFFPCQIIDASEFASSYLPNGQFN